MPCKFRYELDLSTRGPDIFGQFSGFTVFLRGEWATDVFVTNYLPLIMFPVMYLGARLCLKVSPVKPSDMDFQSGLKEIELDSYVTKRIIHICEFC